MHDDVLQLKSEMAKTLSEVQEQNINLASFLDEMTVEAEGMLRKTSKMEEFMIQYGYKPAAGLDTVKMFDLDLEEQNIAPPAATEFEECGEEKSEPNIVKVEDQEMESVKSAFPASPSIYDIGLSKFGLQAVLGRVESSEDRIGHTSSETTVTKPGEVTKSVAVTKPVEVTKPEPPSKYYFPLDEDPDSSPVLRLNTRPLQGALDMSGLDITPGLTRKSNPSRVPAQETPEFPVLQSDASYHQPCQSPPERVSRLPDTDMMGATPELPDLQTISLRELLGQARSAEPSQGTPDLPDLTTTTLSYQ